MVENRNGIFKYFILILLAPILGTAIVFYYSFQYIQKDIMFVNYEVVGIKQVKNIHETINILQEYRNILYSDDYNNPKRISKIQNELKTKLEKIEKSVIDIKDEHSVMPDNIQSILVNINYSIKKGLSAEKITQHIQEFLMLTKDISYSSNLILDPTLDTYLFIQLILFTIPELEEQSSLMKNYQFNSKNINSVIIKISKLEDSLRNFDFDTSKLKSNNTNRQNIINIQSQLIEHYKKMVNNNIFQRDIDIIQLEDYNYQLLKSYYDSTYTKLNKRLKEKENDKRNISLFIVILTLGILLFLVYINNLFYAKNKEFITKIEELSLIDSMTGLYNRRYFDKIFPIKQKTQKRRKKNLIFMMIDIDFFKQYNDTYGHAAGDTVITSVATKLKTSLHRSTDMAFRLGGEEFGILLEDMTPTQSIDFANKLLHEIEDMHIIHEKNNTSNFITISIGLSVIPPETQFDMKKLYQFTDKALYKSKENGRNQVTFCKRICDF